MDGATATVVILIFVFSIFGAVTGKKDGNSGQSPYNEQPGIVYNTVEAVSIPGEVFLAGYADGISDKIKSYILRRNKNISEGQAQNITDYILKYSQQFDVNPKVVTALMARESSFNTFAVSSSNAMGLGQLLPSTAAGLGVNDPFDPEQNTMGTVRYLRSLIDRFSGDYKLVYAIAGYFEGPNAVKRASGFKLKSKSYVEDILKISEKI